VRQKAKEVRDRKFSPGREPASEAAEDLIDEALLLVLSYEHHFGLRKRARRPEDQRTFERTVNAVLSDIAYAHLTAPGEWTVLRLSNRVWSRRSRYRPEVFTTVLPTVIAMLCAPELGFLEYRKGYRGGPFARNVASTIRVTQRFAQKLAAEALEPEDFALSATRETFNLKAAKEWRMGHGDKLEYEDTPETVRFREELARINDAVAGAPLFLTREDPEAHVDLSKRGLYRVFNDGRIGEGGRLYGGFWQELPKQRRHDLRIGRERVVELDYRQMGPRLAYAAVGALPPPGDLYSLPTLQGPSGPLRGSVRAS
jgi:hypothetical protein